MSKKFTSSVSRVPSKKAWRKGQKDTIDLWQDQNSICTKLPTGYGKTFVIDESYRLFKEQNKADRILIIFPTLSQLNQYKKDHPTVWDIGFDSIEALKRHQNSKNDTFIITIQKLTSGATIELVDTMLSTCSWFIAIDEYHHYGSEKSWGITALGLNYTYRLCLSATPYRKDGDDVFGIPDISITYKDAVEEGCVKSLIGHSYAYVVELIKDGEVIQYTTDELLSKLGDGDQLEKKMISSKMRWSPKYISPLISRPIERMTDERLNSGVHLQCLIFALSVSHADMVAKQVKIMFPEYSVEWVGQSDSVDCKSLEDDSKIISDFLKTDKIDILVNYQKAGEGIDSVNVSEIIFLKNAKLNISTLQNVGRASRVIAGVDINGYINFDSSCELAQKNYIGTNIMDALELEEGSEPEGDGGHEAIEYKELPTEPSIIIHDMHLTSINEGERRRMIEVIKVLDMKIPDDIDLDEVAEDKDHPYNAKIIQVYNNMRSMESAKMNEESTIKQWRESVNGAMIKLTSLIVPLWTESHEEKSVRGDIKKVLNSAKKRSVGAISNNLDVLKAHYKWIRDFEQYIINNKKLPKW